jgi:hypothetical protein
MARWGLRAWLGPLVCAAALGAACRPAACQPAVVVAAPAQAAPDDRNAPVEYKALPDARAKTNEILRRREFRRVQQNSFWDQEIAKAVLFLSNVFSKAGDMIPEVPWFATALEWGALAMAAVGLTIWVLRASRQQRVAIAAGHCGPEAWERESDNWAERAREEAGREDWREAVHCLYWSAIVLLEGQKMWRQNRARTPREYVVLLEAGSAKQQALGGLTRVFERIWYGLRPAAETDYRQASAMLEDLRAR